MKRLLIIEDQENVRKMLAMHLSGEGFLVDTASNGEDGIQAFMEKRPDAVLCDVRMPKRDGYEVLTAIREEDKQVPFVMVTAHGDVAGAVRAMKNGASDYALKPFNIDELTLSLQRLLKMSQLESENERLKTEMEHQAAQALIGQSKALRDAVDLLERVAPLPSTVLIQGETGVGKELFARLLHQKSKRRDNPFVAVNCGAIPDTLFESELFGHRKGSFTDAGKDRKGRFEEVDGGTLFLDEIGEMPLTVQPKLLRVLESGEIQKLGENIPRRVDVRLVAATNKNLEARSREGAFREDLYFRLNVFPIHVPPLRDRKEDIPILVDHFMKRFATEFRRPCPEMDGKTMQALMDYNWPGNVRELANTIERMALLYDGKPLDHLIPRSATQQNQAFVNIPLPDRLSPDSFKGTLHDAQDITERTLLERALKEMGGNRTQTAKLIGVSERTLFYKLKDMGLATEKE